MDEFESDTRGGSESEQMLRSSLFQSHGMVDATFFEILWMKTNQRNHHNTTTKLNHSAANTTTAARSTKLHSTTNQRKRQAAAAAAGPGPAAGHSNGHHLELPVLLPDTVIFESGKAIAWYFSALRKGNFGCINKRYSHRLTASEILRRFCRTRDNKLQTSWMSTRRLECVAVFVQSNGPGVHYLTEQQLHEFLVSDASTSHLSDGILQRFMVPSGECNEMVRVNWNRMMCVMERRINDFPLHDSKISLSERVNTFEVAGAQAESRLLRSNNGPGRLISIACDRIAQHLGDIQFSVSE
jgi:hypothetical protein